MGVADDDDSVYIVDIEQLFVQWDVYLPFVVLIQIKFLNFARIRLFSFDTMILLATIFCFKSILCHWSLSIPPEKIRKPEVFLMF